MASRSFMCLAALAVVGCGSGFRADQHADPADLLVAAKREYRRGNCTDAGPAFQRLSFEMAARDPLQGDLRYYLAECQLREREYVEAARQFRRVADEFPRHELAPDALLRAGDAYAELWKRPELDPSYGENALEVWRELMGRYPDTPAAERAGLRVRELNEMFAAKEFKNGEFYLRLRAFDSAILYFRDLVGKYPQSSYAAKAVLRLIATYDRIGYEEEQREMCGYLRQYHPQAYPEAESCPPAPTP